MGQIRLFGDPSHSGTQVPTLSISLSVDIETTSETFVPIIRAPDHNISCDFVGGWAFGDTIGVGVRSLDGWWTVIDVSPAAIISGVSRRHDYSLPTPYAHDSDPSACRPSNSPWCRRPT